MRPLVTSQLLRHPIPPKGTFRDLEVGGAEAAELPTVPRSSEADGRRPARAALRPVLSQVSKIRHVLAFPLCFGREECI